MSYLNKQALWKDHVFLQRLLATCSDCIYVCDIRTRRAMFRTRPLYAELGYELEEVDAPNAVIPYQFLAPQDRIDVDDLFKKIEELEVGKWIDVNFRMLHKMGTYRHFRSRITPLDTNEFGQTNHFIGIITDITDLKRAEALALTGKKNAEHASAAKTRFLNNLSHELRTPLHVLTGAMDLIKTALSNSEHHELLNLGINAITQLKVLVDDSLDLARIEARKVKIESKPFSPKELMQTLYKEFQSIAAERNLEFAVEIDENLPSFVSGDSCRMHQILTNFLSNAFKYTKQGKVTLKSETMSKISPNAILKFSVQDTGPGIEFGFRSHVFERFARGTGTEEKNIPGTGLGLAIAKELAGLMCGKVGLNSAVGQGSTFWFEISLPIAAKLELVSNKAEDTVNELSAQYDATVMVIDDSPDNIRLAEAMLQRFGCKSVLASSGSQALGALEKVTPDLIFLDYRMPGMDGLETAKAIRSQGITLPIIFLTANCSPALTEQAKKIEINEVLQKPLHLKDMQECLDRYVGNTTAITSSTLRRA